MKNRLLFSLVAVVPLFSIESSAGMGEPPQVANVSELAPNCATLADFGESIGKTPDEMSEWLNECNRIPDEQFYSLYDSLKLIKGAAPFDKCSVVNILRRLSRSNAQNVSIDRYEKEALTRLKLAYDERQKQIYSDHEVAELLQYMLDAEAAQNRKRPEHP